MNGVRLSLRVLSVLLAAALLALGVIVTVEIVLAAFGQPPWLLPYPDVASTLREQTWDSLLARAVAVGLCLLGLLLLLPALRRGKPTALPLTPLTDGVDTHVSRRGLQRDRVCRRWTRRRGPRREGQGRPPQGQGPYHHPAAGHRRAAVAGRRRCPHRARHIGTAPTAGRQGHDQEEDLMGAPADRLNRLLVALLGLLLLAGGVLALVRSFGGFGARLTDDRLLTEGHTRFAEDNPWVWIAVAAVAVVLALLALRWLLAQVRSDRAGTLELEPDPRKGATTLHPSAVTAAVCEEIESYRGVRNARARLLHDERHPDLVLDVELDDRADIAATRSRIETDAVAHTRTVLGLDDLPTRLTLTPTGARR